MVYSFNSFTLNFSVLYFRYVSYKWRLIQFNFVIIQHDNLCALARTFRLKLLWTQVLCKLCVLQKISLSCGFFHFLSSVFYTAEGIHFEEILWIILFRVISNKSLSDPRSFRFLFSSRSFITFRCMNPIPVHCSCFSLKQPSWSMIYIV